MRRLLVGLVLGAVLTSGVAAASSDRPGPETEERVNLRDRVARLERIQAGLCSYLVWKAPEDRQIQFVCQDRRP